MQSSASVGENPSSRQRWLGSSANPVFLSDTDNTYTGFPVRHSFPGVTAAAPPQAASSAEPSYFDIFTPGSRSPPIAPEGTWSSLDTEGVLEYQSNQSKAIKLTINVADLLEEKGDAMTDSAFGPLLREASDQLRTHGFGHHRVPNAVDRSVSPMPYRTTVDRSVSPMPITLSVPTKVDRGLSPMRMESNSHERGTSPMRIKKTQERALSPIPVRTIETGVQSDISMAEESMDSGTSFYAGPDDPLKKVRPNQASASAARNASPAPLKPAPLAFLPNKTADWDSQPHL